MSELQPHRLVLGLAAPRPHDTHAHGRADLFTNVLSHLGRLPRRD